MCSRIPAPSVPANTCGEPSVRGGVAVSNLAPVPSDSGTCANCSAPLVADQRYCLSCGQPVSPVRLAFLDVLETERQRAPATTALSAAPVSYAPYVEPPIGPAWLRRYAPLFGVASVLLLAMIAGLLVGHWASQSKASAGPETVKIEGLSGLSPAASSTASTPTTPSASSSKTAASAKSEEAEEKAEAKREEAEEEKHPAKAPPAKSLSSSDVSKLEKTTGKKHEQELSKLTTAPVVVK